MFSKFARSRSFAHVVRLLIPGVLILALSSRAWATAYYVSEAGSDVNSGLDQHKPFQTISMALRHAQPGDAVLVAPGVYREELRDPPGGTDWDHRVRIAALDPDDRPVIRPDPGASRVFTFATARSSYVELDGLVIDGVNARLDAVKITWGTSTEGSHHIRIKNSEIRNAAQNGILVTGHDHGVGHNEFINVEVHNNGRESGHAFYISTPNNIVEESRVFNNGLWGIHNYGGDPSHNIYRNNRFFDNSTSGRGVGIGIYHGEGIQVRHNVVEGHERGISIQYGTSNAEFSGNLVRRNGTALLVGQTATDTFVANNYFQNNDDNSIQDNGVGSTISPPPDMPEGVIRWDTGELIPTAEGISPGPNVQLDRRELAAAVLNEYDMTGSSLSFSSLRQAMFFSSELTDAEMSEANLGGAFFDSATISRANLTDAIITGVVLEDATSRGFRREQLYSTASYKSKDLRGIRSWGNDLAGWEFAGQDLAGASFYQSTLTQANFSQANLANANFGSANYGGTTLDNADLSQANMTDASFDFATMADANLTDAFVRGARFDGTTSLGFSQDQLYSTASYKVGDLTGIRLSNNNLANWSFVGQNLTNTSFSGADLTEANFSQANLTGANLGSSVLEGAELTGALVTSARFEETTAQGLTQDQLASTASYQARDLQGIRLSDNNLTRWNFAGQDLTDSQFTRANLTGADLRQANLNRSDIRSSTLIDADFTDSIVTGTNLDDTTSRGFTKDQLYATSSYKAQNLSRIRLSNNDLTGWNFAHQNLVSASLAGAILTDVDFSDSLVSRVGLEQTTARGLTKEQLYSTASFQTKNLTGMRLSGNELDGWDFADQNLVGASFLGSTMTHADLSRANLTNGVFGTTGSDSATLEGANLTDAIVVGVRLAGTTSRGFRKEQLYSTASYAERELARVDLSSNDLTRWDFVGVNLSGATLRNSDLTDADLTRTNLAKADLRNVTLTGTNLTDAVVAGARFEDSTRRGISSQQLYSTASYKTRNLAGIQFGDADLTGWDISGQDLTDASFAYRVTLTDADLGGATLVRSDLRGANLTRANFTNAIVTGASFENTTSRGFSQEQLYSTASYIANNLRGIRLRDNDLSGWDFSNQNLTDASLDSAILADADLSGAIVPQASFRNATSRGFSPEQLYSTASYQTRELRGINLEDNDLTGWNFAGQNLTNASFFDSILANADFTGADIRGASGFAASSSAETSNMIWPNGEIRGLDLGDNDVLTIRDFDRGIVVRNGFVMDGGQLEIVLVDGDFHSTLVAEAEPQLGGQLHVKFDSAADILALRGTAFDLFDWSEPVSPSNRFGQLVLPAFSVWDLTGLYTSGVIAFETLGDFSSDGILEVSDIDMLTSAVREATNNEGFDLNGDSLVDQRDRGVWVEQLFGTYIGDADLDREVAFSDFTALSESFGFEGGWGQGDFDGTGVVAFPDFVLLAVNFGQPSQQTIASVPEPCGRQLILLTGLLPLVLVRRLRMSALVVLRDQQTTVAKNGRCDRLERPSKQPLGQKEAF